MVAYRLPSVGTEPKLDRHCPQCGRTQGNIHSGIGHRRISDWKVQAIWQRRMKCPYCGITWTLVSQGVSHGRQRSDRLRLMGVALYMFGLSYRSVEQFLPFLECVGGKSSIERDVAEAGQEARRYHQQGSRWRPRVRILGVDGTGAALAGRSAGVLFFADVETGGLVCVEPVREQDAARLRRHVAAVMAEVGAQELRTDEHSAYEGIVPEGRHRLCLTHWRKSKGKRAYDLARQAMAQGRPLEAESMRRLLELLRLKPRPPRPPPELEWLVVRYSRCRKGLLWQINKLLQHVERTWSKVSDDPVDATNNATERIIGLTFKIRSKTMRGFKSMHKVLAHPYLASFLRGEDGLCDLRKVI